MRRECVLEAVLAVHCITVGQGLDGLLCAGALRWLRVLGEQLKKQCGKTHSEF